MLRGRGLLSKPPFRPLSRCVICARRRGTCCCPGCCEWAAQDCQCVSKATYESRDTRGAVHTHIYYINQYLLESGCSANAVRHSVVQVCKERVALWAVCANLTRHSEESAQRLCTLRVMVQRSVSKAGVHFPKSIDCWPLIFSGVDQQCARWPLPGKFHDDNGSEHRGSTFFGRRNAHSHTHTTHSIHTRSTAQHAHSERERETHTQRERDTHAHTARERA